MFGQIPRGALSALGCAAALITAGPALAAETFEGLVAPALEVRLSSAVPGLIETVMVERGDRVTAGQTVVRLRSDVERARLALVTARAEFAERRVVRNEELFLKQMISTHERDEIETEAALLRLEQKQVEAQLALRTVKSPIAGVVVERMMSGGEFVNDDPILHLAQIDPLRIEVGVPSTLYGKIRRGMSATIAWDIVGGDHVARVTVVDSVLDAASGTIGVRLELPNPKGRLPAGTTCRVTFGDL